MGGVFFFSLQIQDSDPSGVEQQNPVIIIIIIFFACMFWCSLCIKEEDIIKFYFDAGNFSGSDRPHILEYGVLSCCLLFAGSQRGVERCSSLLMKYSPGGAGRPVCWGSKSPPNNSELGVFGSPPLWDFWTRTVQAVHGWVTQKACLLFQCFGAWGTPRATANGPFLVQSPASGCGSCPIFPWRFLWSAGKLVSIYSF